MPIPKTSTFQPGLFAFLPENWLIIHCDQRVYYNYRRSMLILEADFCIFDLYMMKQ